MIRKLLKATLILIAILLWISFVGSMWMMTGFAAGFVGLFYLSGMLIVPVGIIYGCMYHPI